MPAAYSHIICIASGKGGAGKTIVAANSSVALQQMGKRVVLLDANLGMANAHIAMGAPCAHHLGHFLSGEKTLQDIMVTTRSGVRLVPGASGVPAMANLSQRQAFSIVQAFSTLEEDMDYLIVDLAAGVAPATLAFLTATQRRFVVVRDDPLSIADACAMVKVLLEDHGLGEMYLLANGVASQQEGQALFQRINQVCARLPGPSIRYAGTIAQDANILMALNKGQTVHEFAPTSLGARDFCTLAQTTNTLQPIAHASGDLEFFIERLVQQRSAPAVWPHDEFRHHALPLAELAN